MTPGIQFGTDGWRDLMCENFTTPNVKVVAQAIANRINELRAADMGVVIGYDTRFFSERFARACAGVFYANGIRIYLPKRSMPTPVTAFSIKTLGAAGAVMITASHNPAEYNGIKFIPDYGGPASKEITDDIEAKIAEVESGGKVVESQGFDYTEVDLIPQYMTHLERLVDFERLRSKGLKVALDPLYGAGYGIMDAIFASAGCDQVDTIHNYRDPLFGDGKPDPSGEQLSDLRRLVLEKGSDLGLAVDGDGDRFGVIDYDGSYLTANQAIALVGRHLLKNRAARGKVVRTVATTHLLDEIANDYGCELVETPVGFKYIAAEMLAGPVVIGGEESGGLSIGGHIPEKDGIIADLLLAEIIAYEEKPLGEVLRETLDRYGNYRGERLDIHLDNRAKEALIERMTEKPPEEIGGSSISEVKAIDGIKYLLENGDWILARASGTEPLVRIYIESKTSDGLAALQDYARSLVGFMD
ncbi:MAG: phosphoglucomutase/phosphomannomutase family protein [Actinobacteria bacterium]|nr:phosphoglucomutase/phosphomannomutase family protein [Actinomycetota bacterium]